MNIGEAMLAVRSGKTVVREDKEGYCHYIRRKGKYVESGFKAPHFDFVDWDIYQSQIGIKDLDATNWEVVDESLT